MLRTGSMFTQHYYVYWVSFNPIRRNVTVMIIGQNHILELGVKELDRIISIKSKSIYTHKGTPF